MEMARLAPGPLSESLQGRNPREIVVRCRALYGDLGVSDEADAVAGAMFEIGIDVATAIGGALGSGRGSASLSARRWWLLVS
jgi:hypothetical protein